MNDGGQQFERFRQEHARLHDPALVRGAVEFEPVPLGEVAFAVPAAGKKKRRLRERTSQVALTVAETPEHERLLPVSFMRSLRAQSREKASQKTRREGAQATAPQGGPPIGVEPESVRHGLSLFQEHAFALDAPAVQQVELLWREEKVDAPGLDASAQDVAQAAARRVQLQRAVMDHRQADRFESQIEIADGSYLFAYSADGRTRPDGRFARRVVLNADGLFAPLTLRRHEQTLTLTNRGESSERVRLESSTPWLVIPQTEIELPARTSVETRVRLHPPTMSEGLNEGLLRLGVKREAEGTAVGIVHFAVQANVGGVVPKISFAPHDLGEIMQGLDELRLSVEIEARGRGTLSGMISLPHSGELADFCLSAGDDGPPRFAHTFRVVSANLPQPQPHRADATLKVMIITDSFLANYRLCHAEIPYRLVHLKKSLPALSFGMVRAGGTKTLRLEVQRSDRQEIDLGVELPDGVAPYLEAYPARADVYVFRFDANALPPGTSVNKTIELIDRKSGLRDQIKVLATVAGMADGGPARAAFNSRTS